MRFRPEPRRIVRNAFVLVALAASVLVGTLVHAALQPEPEVVVAEYPDAADETELPAAVERRRLAVLAELGDLSGHPWAGTYFHGDGEGMNVTMALAPKAGAATWWRGCLGMYGAEHGDVLPRADGTIEIDLPPSDDKVIRFPSELRPVRWGERRYLVEPSEYIDFVNEMNAGWEPRDDRFGRFLLAEGDEARPAPGLPDLPPEFLRLVRREPLEVHVLAVERLPDPERVSAPSPSPGAALDAAPLHCSLRYRLTLDRGADAGLVPGLRLQCDGTCGYERARVVHSDAQRAQAEISLFDSGCDGESPPDRTWVFSTGAFRPSN